MQDGQNFQSDLNQDKCASSGSPFEKASNLKTDFQIDFMSEVYPRFEWKWGNSIDKSMNLAKVNALLNGR